MTQHIEEARKIAGQWNLIDAIAAALAAAEERGRMAERELCDRIVSAAWGENFTIEALSVADPPRGRTMGRNWKDRLSDIFGHRRIFELERQLKEARSRLFRTKEPTQ